MKLRTKLVLIPVMVIILSLTVISIFSLVSFERVSHRKLQENQKLLVESMILTVDEFVIKYKDIITMARESDYVKDTSEYKDIQVATRGLSDKQAVKLRKFFKTTRTIYPQFAYLETFTPDKAVNVVLEPYASQLKISEEAYKKGFAFRDWYIGAMTNKDTYISEAYVSASIMKPVTAISTPIFDNNNNITGIFIGAVELTELSNMTKKLAYGETGVTYIVDKNSHLIAHPDDGYFTEKTLFNMEDNEIVSKVLETDGVVDETVIMHDPITKEDVYVYYEKIDATDWYIISQQAVSESKKSVRALMWTIIFITLILIIGVGFFMYKNANNILRPLLKLTKISEKISENDLALDQAESSSLNNLSRRSDELGVLCATFNTMIGNLIQIITSLSSATNDVMSSSNVIGSRIKELSTSSTEIDTTVHEIARAATDQATQTQDGANMTAHLGRTIEENQQKMVNLNTTFSIIKESNDIAKDNLDKLKDKNNSNNEVTYKLFENVKQTDESSKKISSISSVIASIADQTNLLALNAAIEAARAGEAGKGFAVVADEIRKLAEESTKSTKQIDALLKELQKNSHVSVESINNLIEATEAQLEFLNQTEEHNNKIVHALEEEEVVIQDLNAISEEINKVKENIVNVITDLSAVAEENAAGCEEASAAVTQQSANLQTISSESDHLLNVLKNLSHVVEKFKL